MELEMVKVSCIFPKEIFILGIGKTTSFKDMVFIFTITEKDTKVN